MPTPKYQGSSGVNLAPESGLLKLAERITFQQVLRSRSYSTALTQAQLFPRGTTGTVGGVAMIVDDTTLESERGGIGKITINWARLDTPPPDEYSVVPFEINPRVELADYFSSLTSDDLDKAHSLFKGSTAAIRSNLDAIIGSVTHATLIRSLIAKWRRGQETFYFAGLKYVWTSYSYSRPTVDSGGFQQAPLGPMMGDASFTGMGWLRLSDEMVYQNGLFKLTSSWMGGPSGWWDSDIYP
jgi:hypothetical protein